MTLKDAAICLFAWDLADEGLDHVLGFAAESGLTSLYLASVYHAGWFVLPHNPNRTCYMPQDGAAYFRYDPSFFDGTPIRPIQAEIAKQTDWFEVVTDRLSAYGLQLTAWTVCNHNTPQGLLHPEHTVRNALGDSYPHALSPASPAVREYLRGLVRNLSSRYQLQSVFLEAPNYRGRRHGHHHERVGVNFGNLENALLDISFSEHELQLADEQGLNARSLGRSVAGHLRAFLEHGAVRPSGVPETIEQFYNENTELPRYLALLDSAVNSLIEELHQETSRAGVQLEGVELIDAYDWIVLGAYGKTPHEIENLTKAHRYSISPEQDLRVGVRLGFDAPGLPGTIDSSERCRDCISAACENGASGVYFYNYSESPMASLRWISQALDGVIAS